MERSTRRRNRDHEATVPIAPVPTMNDPLWKYGHEVVALVADYLADVMSAELDRAIETPPVVFPEGTGRFRVVTREEALEAAQAL